MREQGCPTHRTVDCPYARGGGASAAESDRAMLIGIPSNSSSTAEPDCGCAKDAEHQKKGDASAKALGPCGMNDLPFMPAEAATDVRTR